MVRGKVKWFNNRKGYGFVTNSKGKDYFFHYTDIVSETKYKNVEKGQTVEFEIGESNGKEKATNIRTITK
ncbi:MAG TPA: cold shock domain-containing protein [Candidatus Merdenecus merdavium]|nr:cold shock domain-containing protein [Candidatus Merdenecus merdavium]